MYWEPNVSVGDVELSDDEQTSACLALWAAKFLTHAKDYKLKNLNRPHLPANVTHENYRSAKPTDQAEFWFFIERSIRPGSFLWVCSIFGLDPDRVRSKLQPNWRVLYGNPKPLGIEAFSSKALQVIAHAKTVAKKNV